MMKENPWDFSRQAEQDNKLQNSRLGKKGEENSFFISRIFFIHFLSFLWFVREEEEDEKEKCATPKNNIKYTREKEWRYYVIIMQCTHCSFSLPFLISSRTHRAELNFMTLLLDALREQDTSKVAWQP